MRTAHSMRVLWGFSGGTNGWTYGGSVAGDNVSFSRLSSGGSANSAGSFSSSSRATCSRQGTYLLKQGAIQLPPNPWSPLVLLPTLLRHHSD